MMKNNEIVASDEQSKISCGVYEAVTGRLLTHSVSIAATGAIPVVYDGIQNTLIPERDLIIAIIHRYL